MNEYSYSLEMSVRDYECDLQGIAESLALRLARANRHSGFGLDRHGQS